MGKRQPAERKYEVGKVAGGLEMSVAPPIRKQSSEQPLSIQVSILRASSTDFRFSPRSSRTMTFAPWGMDDCKNSASSSWAALSFSLMTMSHPERLTYSAMIAASGEFFAFSDGDYRYFHQHSPQGRKTICPKTFWRKNRDM